MPGLACKISTLSASCVALAVPKMEAVVSSVESLSWRRVTREGTVYIGTHRRPVGGQQASHNKGQEGGEGVHVKVYLL